MPACHNRPVLREIRPWSISSCAHYQRVRHWSAISRIRTSVRRRRGSKAFLLALHDKEESFFIQSGTSDMTNIFWPLKLSQNVATVVACAQLCCIYSLYFIVYCRLLCWKYSPNYLKMKIKSMRSPKNTATLSIVLNITERQQILSTKDPNYFGYFYPWAINSFFVTVWKTLKCLQYNTKVENNLTKIVVIKSFLWADVADSAEIWPASESSATCQQK